MSRISTRLLRLFSPESKTASPVKMRKLEPGTYYVKDPRASKNPLEDFRSLSTSDRDRMGELLGPPRVRNTVVEATVRMIADHFMYYDSMDKALMNEKLERNYGTNGLSQQGPSQGQSNKLMRRKLLRQRAQKFNKHNVDPRELFDLTRQDMKVLGKLSNRQRFAHQAKRRGEVFLHHNVKGYTKKIDRSSAGDVWPWYYRHHETLAKTRMMTKVMEIGDKKNLLRTLATRLVNHREIPDLEVFHQIIKKLQIEGHYRAAQMALKVLRQSYIPLNAYTFAYSLKNAVMFGNRNLFLVYMQVFDLSKDNNPTSGMPMSHPGRTRRSWVVQEDPVRKRQRGFLKSRYFPVGHEQKDALGGLALAYEQLIIGFFKFGHEDYVDPAIRQMIRLQIPIRKGILLTNLKLALRDRDEYRALWTWEYILNNCATLPRELSTSVRELRKKLAIEFKHFDEIIRMRGNIPANATTTKGTGKGKSS
uniref:ARAD1C08756p n=1 Tax=Blastobotrys adeninivorans TaxID=409370 RepID=A0A060T002_BLAAD